MKTNPNNDETKNVTSSDSQNSNPLTAHAATTLIAPSSTKHIAVIATIYLLGLFIGALDTGIVTPARTVIQNGFGIDDAFGVWMITIYTLAYAVSIPIMGKLADMYGRKGIYLISIALFGIGSLGCGLSELIDNYYVLLFARAIQAFGGGGIMPIATAELGTTFPPEKRGMALGLVGGVYGIANIFGASAGSLILDIFGQQNWSFIFYVNVPVCIFIFIAGIVCLPKSKNRNVAPIDILGILILTCMILSLLIGLKNIDFFDLANSIKTIEVYPYLILTLLLIPFFIVAERHAQDSVMNLSYFKNPRILITLILSILTGVIMMGMIFIPQFAENAMKMPSGSGGYFVIILGLFAGFGAPMSGKLIDKFGVKLVLSIGFIASVAGCLYLAFIATANPTLFNVVLSLILIGIGMGFVMGTPLNYMMLENTEESESNSALATLSLVRSIGTAVAPAIMVGFLVHAAATLPDSIIDELPKQVTVSALPHAQELTDEINKYKNDENTSEMMSGIDTPNLLDMQIIDINIDSSNNSNYQISDDLLAEMQDSDVTTIVETTKHMASEMFAQMKPDLMSDIENNIQKGSNGLSTASSEIDASIKEMNEAIDELNAGIEQLNTVINQQQSAQVQMENLKPMLAKFDNYSSIVDLIPDEAKSSIPNNMIKMLSNIKTIEDLDNQTNSINSAIEEIAVSIDKTRDEITSLQSTLNELETKSKQLTATLEQSKIELEEAKANDDEEEIGRITLEIEKYQKEIDDCTTEIANTKGQIDTYETTISKLSSSASAMQQALEQLNKYRPTLEQISSYTSIVDLIPQSAKEAIPNNVLQELSQVKNTDDLSEKINALTDAIDSLNISKNEMLSAKDEMVNAIKEMETAQNDIALMKNQITEIDAAIPGLFDEAEENYLKEIDNRKNQIENAFQEKLNEGFKGMFILVALCSLAGLILVIFYRNKKTTAN